MAFDVTPTSGAGPYTFTSQFANGINIDNENYQLLFQSTDEVGACPSEGLNVNIPNGVTSLLNNGVFITSNSVSAGSCRAYTLRIRDLINNTFISSVTVQISNV